VSISWTWSEVVGRDIDSRGEHLVRSGNAITVTSGHAFGLGDRRRQLLHHWNIDYVQGRIVQAMRATGGCRGDAIRPGECWPPRRIRKGGRFAAAQQTLEVNADFRGSRWSGRDRARLPFRQSIFSLAMIFEQQPLVFCVGMTSRKSCS